MADWTNITDTAVDPDAPLTSQLGYAWRDNPIAIAEGAAGAPRIRGEAAMPFSSFPILTVSASDAFSMDSGLTITPGTLSTTATGFITAITIVINKFTGVIRFKATHYSNIGFSQLRITKNNVEVNSWINNSSTPTERVEDVPVVPGNTIRWQHLSESGAISTVENIGQYSSDAYVPVGLFARASNL